MTEQGMTIDHLNRRVINLERALVGLLALIHEDKRLPDNISSGYDQLSKEMFCANILIPGSNFNNDNEMFVSANSDIPDNGPLKMFREENEDGD